MGYELPTPKSNFQNNNTNFSLALASNGFIVRFYAGYGEEVFIFDKIESALEFIKVNISKAIQA